MSAGFLPPLALQAAPELAELKARLNLLGYDTTDMAVAIGTFQAWNGMEVTGNADAATTGKMFASRCALPDIMPSRAEEAKWRDQNIGFAIIAVALNGISASRVAEIYAAAWDAWRKVCGLLPKAVEFAAANIQAKIGKIDGRSGTLAWSYLPSTGKPSEQLAQLYDNQEAWTEAFTLEVMIHENGHAIGLEHDKSKEAIMYPYSTGGKVTAPQPLDIERAVATYGPPIFVPSPPVPPTPWPPTGPSLEVEFKAPVPVGRYKLVPVGSNGTGGGEVPAEPPIVYPV